MIFFVSEGQLGNQIFQYFFLKHIQQDRELIIVFGFDELKIVFQIDDIMVINKKNRIYKKLFTYIIKPILTFLSRKNFISSIKVKYEPVLENYKSEIGEYNIVNGIFKVFRYVDNGFFQSEKFIDSNILKQFRIRKKWTEEASSFLEPIKTKYKVFVHIRRGDYKDYKIYGNSTLLPFRYYHDCIKWFLQNKQNVFFVFLSDEPDIIENEFLYLKNKIISRNDYAVDFALMTLCDGAVLSPSSFGWWGSYMMEKRDVVFAPKYWLGFNSNEIYPKGLSNMFIREVEIK